MGLKKYIILIIDRLFVFKKFFVECFLSLKDKIVVLIYGYPIILNSEETVKQIISNKSSIARFGDGEFKLMYEIADLKFQKRSALLASRLKEVLLSDIDNLFIGIPKVFSPNERFQRTAESSNFWKHHLFLYRSKWYNLLKFDRIYYNASFTRNYIGVKDKVKSADFFSLVRKIWEDRDIILIEGKFSRVGVGNNLLDNAKSVRRIIAPSENAFESYDKIIDSVLNYDRNALILIALGPAATILAKDLHCKGFQSIDIGHIDIEYEWSLNHETRKVPVPNKYTIEANAPILNDNFNDEKYSRQVIQIIE